MKKILFFVCLVCSLVTFSQEMITEGIVISKQTMSSDNEQINAQLAMMGDMVTTTYFKGNKSRSEMSNPMAGASIIIMDNDSKTMLMMLDNAMTGKKYVEKTTEPSEEDLKNITVEKGDETKTISGYVCDKYKVTTVKDGLEITMDIYSTNKISALSQQTSGFGDLFKGFPMYMEMKLNQMGMDILITHEVTEVKTETISSDKFDMTPLEGYEKTDKLEGM